MIDLYFVDSNVRIYERDTAEPDKQRQASQWLSFLWQTRAGRLSYQVLQEFYAVTTRKLQPGLTAVEARECIVDYLTWAPKLTDESVLHKAWQLEDAYAISCWDSLIVAAALNAGCRYLVTEDLQDGQDIGGLAVVSPFQHSPPSANGPRPQIVP